MANSAPAQRTGRPRPASFWSALFFCALLAPNAAAVSLKVEVSGVRGELRANVQAFLGIRALAGNSTKASNGRSKNGTQLTAPRVRRAHGRATAEIEQALQPFGYYTPTVDASLELKGDVWLARYDIEPGPRANVGRVDAWVVGDGRDEPGIVAALALIDELEDKPLDHRDYEVGKRALLSAAHDRGYLDAEFKSAALTIVPDEALATVDLTFDTGRRYFFGAVVIEQDILEPELVQRYHSIGRGDPFSTARLVDLQLKLTDTNYFEEVTLDIQRDAAVEGYVPVTVKTKPRKRQRWSAGIGFGTDTGPRFRVGLDNRRVNRRGHRLRTDLRTSTLSDALQTEYQIPIKQVAADRLRLTARVEQTEVSDADTTQYALGLSREDTWHSLRRRLFLNAQRENFEIGSGPSQSATLFYPGISLAYERHDDPQYVRRGFSASATLLGGAKWLGSETDFVKASLNGRLVLPLGRKARLLTGLELARITTDDIDRLPPSQRLYAGGDRSVRGYGYQSLSPENAAGDDVGGTYLAAFSVEVDTLVRDQWGVAAFFDAGTASRALPDTLSKGVGIGLRYRSPVGQIRVDFAHPMDDPDSNFRLHLSIGADL